MDSSAGSHAVVTGASGDVGAAIAAALAAPGGRLLLSGRDLGRLEAAAAPARATGALVATHAADLADEAQVACLAAAAAAGGPLDVLVHAMGAFAAGTIGGAEGARDLDLLYRSNVRVPWLLTRALLPALLSARGQVVFLNSTVGLRARAGVGAYAASKHALRAMADALRDEVNPYGVRVISVFLGRTASAMQRQVSASEGRDYQPHRLIQPADVAAAVRDALALPRTVEVTDLHLRPMTA